MIVSEQHLQESLNTKNFGPVGFGHGQLKYSAEIAASLYGCEWANKNPSSLENINLKIRLRDLVLSNTPVGHSNRDVVWQRFRQYAIRFSTSQDFCKAGA
jgi:hypothetical protein